MPNLETPRKVLKVLGILSIIGGALGIIFGLLAVAGGGLLAGEISTPGAVDAANMENAAAATGLVLIAGIALLLSGIFSLLLGIFSVRGANDFSKVNGAFILAVIDIVVIVLGIVCTIASGSGLTGIGSSIFSLIFAGAICWAAKTINDGTAGGGTPEIPQGPQM